MKFADFSNNSIHLECPGKNILITAIKKMESAANLIAIIIKSIGIQNKYFSGTPNPFNTPK